MLHNVIYNYKINKDLEKSRQGKEIGFKIILELAENVFLVEGGD